MTVVVVVLGAVVVALVTVIVRLYRRVGDPEWGKSDLRMSAIAFLAAVGPFFGIRVREQKPEVPTISTPKNEGDDPGPVSDLGERIEADDDIQGPIPVRRGR